MWKRSFQESRHRFPPLQDGTVRVQSFVDAFLHEAAESAVNGAWMTRVQPGWDGVDGQWEVADVCDGFRKRQADGSILGGIKPVQFGSITLDVSTYLFDLRTGDCALASGNPPLPPRVGPPSAPIGAGDMPATFGTVQCVVGSDEGPPLAGLIAGFVAGPIALAWRIFASHVNTFQRRRR